MNGQVPQPLTFRMYSTRSVSTNRASTKPAGLPW
jgi:hypothetical protein